MIKKPNNEIKPKKFEDEKLNNSDNVSEIYTENFENSSFL